MREENVEDMINHISRLGDDVNFMVNVGQV